MPDDDREPIGFDFLSKKLEAALDGTEDELANGELNELSDESYLEALRQPRTTLVEFYTSVCPYCKHMNPILEELAEKYESKVFFAKVNIEEVEGSAEKFGVLGVPAIIVLKKGTPVGRVEGLRSFEDLDDWIDSIHKGLRPMGIDPGPSTRIS
ncbi:MAG: thioredoxin family protein [Candidatus Thorarchaeota archaeon]